MIESWQTVDLDAVQTQEDLILARMQQLGNRWVTETLAAANLRNSCKGNKTYFDQHHCLRPESQQLRVGDLVLLLNSALQKTRNTKLLDNWRGPYRITEIPRDSTFYQLEELDGTPLVQPFAGNRLKKFSPGKCWRERGLRGSESTRKGSVEGRGSSRLGSRGNIRRGG
jgi:hypothetical protein